MRQSGFSLIELMIVVAIIGVLAALAVPKFANFMAKGKQAEAKNNLSHIYTLEQAWFGDHDTFSRTLSGAGGIGFQVDGHSRYNYTVTVASTAAFAAMGEAKSQTVITPNCHALDAWTIDDAKVLTAALDCTQQ